MDAKAAQEDENIKLGIIAINGLKVANNVIYLYKFFGFFYIYIYIYIYIY